MTSFARAPTSRVHSAPLAVSIWPRGPAVDTVLRVARLADQATNRKPYLQQLQKIAVKFAAQPEIPEFVQKAFLRQGSLIGSYMAGPMRNRKLPWQPQDPLMASFMDLALQSMEGFLFGCEVSAHMWDRQDPRQRALVNAGADACQVSARTGKVGMRLDESFSEDDFANIVHTSTSDQLVTLLAQGPKTPEQIERHLDAVTKHAQLKQCAHVVFINVSLDKVDCFGAAVRARREPGMALEYRSLPWNDGDVFDTPEKRLPLIQLVNDVADGIAKRGGRTLVAINCHIGMDRSAMTVALMQLKVDHNNAAEAVVPVVAKVKAARPHAISTPLRMMMVNQCAAEGRELAMAF